MEDPEVIGKVTPHLNVVRVKCPFCKSYHTHGWPSPLSKREHRFSHCVKGEPRGYYITRKP